jgi:LAS superfamily LD-carboxypeptidase LdcB
MTINYTKLDEDSQIIITEIMDKWERYVGIVPADRLVIIDYCALLDELNHEQKTLIKHIFSIDPKELGFKGPYYSMEKPENLIKLNSVKFEGENYKRESGVQYFPKHAYDDFMKMSDKMEEEIGKRIYIDSGYRSPGRQAYLFFKYLKEENNYSLYENAKWIAMPGYSEHGHPINTAVDISNREGINGFSDNQKAGDFEKLAEYDWLINNASKFNFHLSYPKDNVYGVAFEPWHWHWEKK